MTYEQWLAAEASRHAGYLLRHTMRGACGEADPRDRDRDDDHTPCPECLAEESGDATRDDQKDQDIQRD